MHLADPRPNLVDDSGHRKEQHCDMPTVAGDVGGAGLENVQALRIQPRHLDADLPAESTRHLHSEKPHNHDRHLSA